MTIEVRYYSRSGNTKKVAEAIAAAVGVKAQPLTAPLPEKVDLLFLGSAVYAGALNQELADFIASLSAAQVGKAAIFSTSVSPNSPAGQMRALLKAQKIPVMEKDFHSFGKFLFLQRGRPNEQDLAAAAAFANECLASFTPASTD